MSNFKSLYLELENQLQSTIFQRQTMSLFCKLFLITIFAFSSIASAETKIGVILPLTGGAAEYGIACNNGITLAQEDFKEKIGGRFSVVFENDQNSPALTVSSLRKLRAFDKSEFFLTFASNTSNSVNSLADKEGFILFALATDPNVVKNKKNVFSYWVTPEEEVKTLIAELNRRNIKRIALFSTQQDGILSIKNTLQGLAATAGIEIVFDEEFSPDNRDFRTSLGKLTKIKNLDGIFNNLYVDQVGLFAKQAHELGFKLPIFDIELYESAAVVESSQGALEGQFYINAPIGEKKFAERYRARFPSNSPSTAANCYDFIGLLATSPELTVDGFRKYLETLKDYPGAVGKSSASGDHRFTLPAVVKEIRGKEFVTLDR